MRSLKLLLFQFSERLFQNVGHGPRAHRPAALADRKPQPFVHRDRRDQLDLQVTLSPGITISVPAGNCVTPVTSVVRK